MPLPSYLTAEPRTGIHSPGDNEDDGAAKVGGHCPTANSGGAGNKPPGGKVVAAPGDDNNPFKDGGPFKTFDDAVGLPPGSLENMENIGDAQDRTMRDHGFTQKWIGQDWATGDWYSAFRNPDTGEFAGGDTSSHQP